MYAYPPENSPIALDAFGMLFGAGCSPNPSSRHSRLRQCRRRRRRPRLEERSIKRLMLAELPKKPKRSSCGEEDRRNSSESSFLHLRTLASHVLFLFRFAKISESSLIQPTLHSEAMSRHIKIRNSSAKFGFAELLRVRSRSRSRSRLGGLLANFTFSRAV